MSGSELEGEISASVEITEAGVKAAAKSRTLNALDWIGGTYLISLLRGREGKSAEQAAISKARVKFIEAAGEMAVAQLKENPELARSAMEAQLGSLLRREDNKAATLVYAVEDLKASPPSEEESETGPERLSEDTMNRWGRYAEDATSDDLRQRWGRVLAAEIKRPGTFSAKVMRAIDELDSKTAKLFEEFCASEMVGMVPTCLFRKLNFDETVMLVGAGLIVDPGITGHLRVAGEGNLENGSPVWSIELGDWAFVMPKDIQLNYKSSNETDALILNDGRPAIPAIILTSIGSSIRSIMQPHTVSAFSRWVTQARNQLPEGMGTVYARVGDRYLPASHPAS